MYIQSKDKRTVVNLEKYDVIYVAEGTSQLIAQKDGEKVLLGRFETDEEAMESLESLLQSMLDEVTIYEVE